MFDNYTKVVLTIIAGCLLAQTFGLGVPTANAFGSGQDVRITNLETDMSMGETLWVYCTNC
jgi:hypothetical protein